MESVTFPTDERGAAHTDCILPSVDPTPELLTFESLNQRLSTMPDYDAPTQNSRRWSRIAITIAALSYLAALGIPRMPIDGGTQAILLLAFLVVEVVGLSMSMWITRGDFRTMFRPMEELSRQLDHDFDYHFSLRTWLMEQPEDRLRKYASMAAFRRERYAQKLPMLAGAIPTLGIIPVLVAIYFQGRQLIEGRHLSVVDWLFGFALLLFYVLTWTSSIAKSRLDSMEMHLQGALNELEKKTQPDATSP